MTVSRQIVIEVPPEYEPGNLTPAKLRTLQEAITKMVTTTVVAELGVAVRVASATFLITCKPAEVDDLDACEIGSSCATCGEGRRQAKLFLAEHPGKHVAIGVLSFALAHRSIYN